MKTVVAAIISLISIISAAFAVDGMYVRKAAAADAYASQLAVQELKASITVEVLKPVELQSFLEDLVIRWHRSQLLEIFPAITPNLLGRTNLFDDVPRNVLRH